DQKDTDNLSILPVSPKKYSPADPQLSPGRLELVKKMSLASLVSSVLCLKLAAVDNRCLVSRQVRQACYSYGFDRIVHNLQYFNRNIIHFHAGSRFRDGFKLFQDHAVQGFGAIGRQGPV